MFGCGAALVELVLVVEAAHDRVEIGPDKLSVDHSHIHLDLFPGVQFGSEGHYNGK